MFCISTAGSTSAALEPTTSKSLLPQGVRRMALLDKILDTPFVLIDKVIDALPGLPEEIDYPKEN